VPDENANPRRLNQEGSPVVSLAALAWLWSIRTLRVVLPVAVVWLVWHELKTLDWRDAEAILRSSDMGPIVAALGATAIALAAMGCYDWFAFHSTPTLGPTKRWSVGVLIFSWTNFLTFGPIAGPVLRLLLYRRGGLTSAAIAAGLTKLYIGIFGGLGGWVIATLAPISKNDASIVFLVTIALLASVSVTIALGKLLQLKGPLAGVRTPWTKLAALGVVGMLDWAGVLAVFALCGLAVGTRLHIVLAARALFLGQVAGVISMIPGGIGSADAVWLKLLAHAGATTEQAAAQILLFRIVFYLTPWVTAMVVMYLLFAARWRRAAKWQRRVLAAAAFVNGLYLLLSAATPAVASRLQAVAQRLPISAIEASHAASIIAAATLLYLARGLSRGYRAAFIFAVVSLIVSAGAHLLKGGDFEEATSSVGLLVLLIGARSAFHKRGRIPIGWEPALFVGAVSVAIFLIIGFVAFSKIPYHGNLWITFSAKAEASRFLRGAALLTSISLLVTLRQAMRPVSRWIRPSEDDIDRAVEFIQSHAVISNHLMVAVGDKGVWWWRDNLGVALYQCAGDWMIVFRDPACEQEHLSDLLSDLHEKVDREDLNIVFYQVSPALMPHLHDFGYSFFKLGEEAVVPIEEFSFAGRTSAGFRRTVRKIEAAGIRFRVIEPTIDDETIGRLRDVSDAWLKHKRVHELQCSVGYFTPSYIRRFPVGVAETAEGTIVAFVNLLFASPGSEATVDLMRYRAGVAENLMDYVLIRSMLWAGARGYRRFNLGMSPLYDVGQQSSAALLERTARLAFRFGERVYNYKGLHNYKNKFHPVWEPRYMAYPRPWDWPSAALETTRLIRATSHSARRRIALARLKPSLPGEASLYGTEARIR